MTWLSLFFFCGACTQVQSGWPRHQGGSRVAQTPGTCPEESGGPELAASHSARPWTDTCALLNCLNHHHQYFRVKVDSEFPAQFGPGNPHVEVDSQFLARFVHGNLDIISKSTSSDGFFGLRPLGR